MQEATKGYNTVEAAEMKLRLRLAYESGKPIIINGGKVSFSRSSSEHERGKLAGIIEGRRDSGNIDPLEVSVPYLDEYATEDGIKVRTNKRVFLNF